jgi:hypothetical protein
MAEGFLSRWARLKRERDAGEGEPPAALPEDPRAAEPARVVGARDGQAAAKPVRTEADSDATSGDAATELAMRTEAPRAPGEPPLELPPVDSLTPDSDYTPFLRPGVAPATRNAALKKLFADPAFNVMDGLDVYIEDYNQTTPIPEGLLRRLAQSRAVGLFDEPVDEPRVGEPSRVASTAERGAPDAPVEAPEAAGPVQERASAGEEGDGARATPIAADPQGEVADPQAEARDPQGERSPQ